MFSENWPNRARQWLPMIDHPYDKATGEFVVTAPAHYQVVANGLLVEEARPCRTACGARTGSSRCRSRRGSTRSASRGSRSTTTTSCAASRSRCGSFRRIASRARPIFELTGRQAFEFFSDWIGPYSYEKLAHVQAGGHRRRHRARLGDLLRRERRRRRPRAGRARSRAPVVGQRRHREGLGRCVAERGVCDVLHASLHRAVRRTRRVRPRPARRRADDPDTRRSRCPTSRSSTATSRT